MDDRALEITQQMQMDPSSLSKHPCMRLAPMSMKRIRYVMLQSPVRFYQILQNVAYLMMDFWVSLGILSVFIWPTACASSSPGRDRQALDEEITKLNKDGFDAQLEDL